MAMEKKGNNGIAFAYSLNMQHWQHSRSILLIASTTSYEHISIGCM